MQISSRLDNVIQYTLFVEYHPRAKEAATLASSIAPQRENIRFLVSIKRFNSHNKIVKRAKSTSRGLVQRKMLTLGRRFILNHANDRKPCPTRKCTTHRYAAIP